MTSFDQEDTFIKVVDVIAKKIKIDNSKIKRESTLQELGVDSLDTFEILLKLQDRFGIEIEDSAADNFTDIHRIVEYIHTKRTK